MPIYASLIQVASIIIGLCLIVASFIAGYVTGRMKKAKTKITIEPTQELKTQTFDTFVNTFADAQPVMTAMGVGKEPSQSIRKINFDKSTGKVESVKKKNETTKKPKKRGKNRVNGKKRQRKR
jgi:hypothetical protein